MQAYSHLAPADRKKAILAARRVRYHQLKAEEAERVRKARAAEARAKLRKEREADEARGPPPAPCRDFRLPPHLLPDILMTWELLQVHNLQLVAIPSPPRPPYPPLNTHMHQHDILMSWEPLQVHVTVQNTFVKLALVAVKLYIQIPWC